MLKELEEFSTKHGIFSSDSPFHLKVDGDA